MGLEDVVKKTGKHLSYQVTGLANNATSASPYVLAFILYGLADWQVSISDPNQSERTKYVPGSIFWLALTCAEIFIFLIACANMLKNLYKSESKLLGLLIVLKDIFIEAAPPAGYATGCILASEGTKWGTKLAAGYVLTVAFFYDAVAKFLKATHNAIIDRDITKMLINLSKSAKPSSVKYSGSFSIATASIFCKQLLSAAANS